MRNASQPRTEPRRTARHQLRDPRQRLVARITSCWQTQALAVAVELGLPDHLSTGREFAHLLESAGFTVGATFRTRHEFTVIDARRR